MTFLLLALTRLHITQFRNIPALSLDDLARVNVLHGPNGAGKTNILEAMSLLLPGRGLRGAEAAEWKRHGAGAPWRVFAEISTTHGSHALGTGWDETQDKRVFRLNDSPLKNTGALADFLSILWLTPDMDRLLGDSDSVRRRFLDRLVTALQPEHAGRLTRFEKAARERALLLEDNKLDAGWLSGLEAEMARTGAALAAARVECVQALDTFARAARGPFPRARLSIHGTLEDALQQGVPALLIEERYMAQLQAARAQDAASGHSEDGPRRSQFAAHFLERDMPAHLCSSGEQKALLLSLLLAQAQRVLALRGFAPLILLDDVPAHLDPRRRAELFEWLSGFPAQFFLSGPEPLLFQSIEKQSKFIEVGAP